MPQQTAARVILFQRHAPEAVAVDSADTVVPGQSLVQERIVRAEQLEQAAVVAHGALDEQFGLASERHAQILVELGVVGRLALLRLEVPQPQPLTHEVVDERSRTGICEETSGLLLEHGRVTELPTHRDVQQFVVRDAAPQEERQPGREFHIADAVGRVREEPRRVTLDAEQEVGVHEHPFERELNTGVEVPLAPPGRIELHQGRHFAVTDRPAIGPAGQPRENAARARRFVRRRGGPADQNFAPTRRIARAVERIRTADRDLLDARVLVIAFIDETAVAAVARLQHAFGFGQPPDERHAHGSLTRLGGKPDFQPGIPRVHVVLPLGIPGDVPGKTQRGHLPDGIGVTHRKAGDELTIHPYVELLRRRKADDVVRKIPVQANLDGVLAVHRKVVPDRNAATRPERERVVLTIVLQQTRVYAIAGDSRSDRRGSHGETTDLSSGGQVSRYQIWRN